MDKDFRSSVTITITSESIENGEHEEQRVDVRGDWVKKGDTYFLRYYEEERATSTLVKWTAGVEEVFVIRQGDASVRQHFVPKHDLYTVYTTPYGQFSLRTVTNQLQATVNETEGRLYMHYFTQFDDAEPIEHRMNIAFQLLS